MDPSQPPSETPVPQPALFHSLLLVLLILAGILPGLFMGLHADDWFQVRPRGATEVLSTFAGDWNEGRIGAGGFFRPLVRVSFSLDSSLWGLNPFGYHLTNGLLYGLILWALFACGRKLFPERRCGILLILAIVFAFNPLKNEALYWVSGRTDLLAAAFLFWSVFFTLQALDRETMRSAIAALGLLLLALLSKEVALAGCLVLPILAALLGEKSNARTLLLTAPVTLGLVYIAYRSLVLGGVAGYTSEGSLRPIWDFARHFGFMVSALFAPWQAEGPVEFRLAYALFGAILIFLFVVLTGLRRPAIAMALCMLVSLLPMVFVPISPLDGTRVLVLGLGFQALFFMAFFLSPSFPRWLRSPAAFFGILIGFSWQPDNLGITRQYIQAWPRNRQTVETAWEWIDTAPSGSTFIFPGSLELSRRRILNPGEALVMAMQARWMQHPEASTADITNLAERRFGLRFQHPGKSITTAVILQPWMEDSIYRFFYSEHLRLEVLQLERTSLQTFDGPFSRETDPGRLYSVVSVARESPGKPPYLQIDLTEEESIEATGISLPRNGETVRWIALGPYYLGRPASIAWQSGTESSLRVSHLGMAEYRVEAQSRGGVLAH